MMGWVFLGVHSCEFWVLALGWNCIKGLGGGDSAYTDSWARLYGLERDLSEERAEDDQHAGDALEAGLCIVA